MELYSLWGGSAVQEATSKHIDGIADLVVVAPIREGFIKAFETISYVSRLELSANALNRIRVAAREYERVVPFSDVTERILSLLDFRVGVIDRNMFGLVRHEKDGLTIRPQRYLYLAATFEGGFEPYMRQIWKPLGPFLDLLFCNCEGYVTANEHSFDEYIQWVRDNQVDSAIFYNTTGVTVRDQKYLSAMERAQRGGKDDTHLTEMAMAYPDDDARMARGQHPRKAAELGFEALNVLHKLADYFPPEWMTGSVGDATRPDEGHRLIRATRDILQGWEPILKGIEQAAAANPAGPQAIALKTYEEPVTWFKTGIMYLAQIDARPNEPDPAFTPAEVQDGIIHSHGPKGVRTPRGAMMLFTVRDAEKARGFIKKLMDEKTLSFAGEAHAAQDSRLFVNIAFTAHGLTEMGMYRQTLNQFPKEFREGLARRNGLVGDMRENHPRNWTLPARNGASFLNGTAENPQLPPVEMAEVDFVLQIRATSSDAELVRSAALRLAHAAAPGATLESIEWLHLNLEEDTGVFRDHFGFVDGISQPKPKLQSEEPSGLARDTVAMGEVLLGYGNDRGDGPPTLFATHDGDAKPDVQETGWRNKYRRWALDFQRSGSYLVVRKMGEDVSALDAWLDQQKSEIAVQLGCTAEEARATLKAAIMGRDSTGCPLSARASEDFNDFDFKGDAAGRVCPHAAHIRRANPRRTECDPLSPAEVRREFGRPTPRMVRRGMLFGGDTNGPRGLMFMAYVSSIAEQYEVVQRWLNGGNPTDVFSANNDPLTGVYPKDGANTFRFIAKNAAGENTVLRVTLPGVTHADGKVAEPGRHPFTPLYWGLYLIAPSHYALTQMTDVWTGGYRPMGEMLERQVGLAWLEKLKALPAEEAGKEWKRLLEDFVAKDPSEDDISPHLWSAIRYYRGGAVDLRKPFGETDLSLAGADEASARRVMPGGILKGGFDVDAVAGVALAEEFAVEMETDGQNHVSDYDWADPNVESQNVIICAGTAQVVSVLSDWENFSSEEQLRRIKDHAGPIYVTQQPDDDYKKLNPVYKGQRLNYHNESEATNKALFEYSEEASFITGYAGGKAVLDGLKAKVAEANGGTSPAFKIELKRQFIQPAIAEVWKKWYGLPDEQSLFSGGWSWKKLVEDVVDAATERSGALCPGDFMAPSRGSVFPRPNDSITAYAKAHGAAILEAGRKFVDRLHHDPSVVKTPLIERLFAAHRGTDQKEVLARNIIGTMIGAIPPMDANLRNILLDWLLENRLWRHQGALQAALAGQSISDKAEAVRAALRGPISQAMCKRPAPDLLFRTAKRTTVIVPDDNDENPTRDEEKKGRREVIAQEGDLVVVSLASASQRTLDKDPMGIGDVSVIFGGKRDKPLQGYRYENGCALPADKDSNDGPVHACPATKMAMGAMTGILAALLETGTIQALPASLIVRISDWSLP